MTFFKKLRAACKKARHPLCVLAILVCCAVLAGWVYVRSVRPATQEIEYTRMNEDYSVLTDALQAGETLTQPFATSENVYGAAFVFHTFNRVPQGTVTVRLLDGQSGAVLATGTHEMSTLLDNTYQEVLFDVPVLTSGETNYIYAITVQGASAEDVLAFWRSENATNEWQPYEINGEPQNATLGFTVVTNVAGTGFVTGYWLLAALAALTLALGYVLLFWWQKPLQAVLAVVLVGFGLVYCFALPPYGGPDEQVHVYTSYNSVNKLQNVEGAKDGATSLREGDVNAAMPRTADKLSVFSYQMAAQELFGKCENETMVPATYGFTTGYDTQYVGTTLGMMLARALHFNFLTCIYFARFGNLLLYSLLMVLAVALAPARTKRIFFLGAVLPSALNTAATCSYDATLLGLAFLFTALCLRFALRNEKMTWKHIVLLAVLGCLLAPMKGVYVFLCALCLLIPKANYQNDTHYFAGNAAVLGVSAFSWLWGNAGYIRTYLSLMGQNSAPTPSDSVLPETAVAASSVLATAADSVAASASAVSETIGSAIDSAVSAVSSGVTQWTQVTDNAAQLLETHDYTARAFYSLGHILANPSATLKLLANTVQENTGLYFSQLVGGEVGEPILSDIFVAAPIVFVMLLVLLLAMVPQQEEAPLLKRGQKAWGVLLILGILGVTLVTCLGWTPVENTTLWGMQGRYLLPVLPLALLILQGKTLKLQKDIEKPLTFCMLCCVGVSIACVAQSILG